MIFALLLACSSLVVGEPAPLELSTWAVDGTASGGVLMVQTRAEEGLSYDLPVPEVEGLTFTPVGEPRRETLEDHVVVTQKWRYTGKKGSYEIPALTITAADHEATSEPVWVDLGVDAPNAGQLADIVDPAEYWTFPWGWVAAGLAVAALFVLGAILVLARLLKPRPKVVVLPPPDVRALTAWEQVRGDGSLSDEEKASELSNIFREYTEEVLQFPATAWTTTEILERLKTLTHLPEGNVPRAKRLLQATDLIKYAEEDADGEFLDHLDSDLRSFIGGTRPRGWDPEGQQSREPAG